MSVTVIGAEVLIKRLRKMKEAANKAAEREVNRARLAVETTAKKLIQKGPKTGIIYYKTSTKTVTASIGEIATTVQKTTRRKHQASAPGEAPATDTGTLVSSIESKMELTMLGKASAVVWTEKDYGKFLEFGTVNMEPRPWLTPAVELNRTIFPEVLGKAVVKAAEGEAKK